VLDVASNIYEALGTGQAGAMWPFKSSGGGLGGLGGGGGGGGLGEAYCKFTVWGGASPAADNFNVNAPNGYARYPRSPTPFNPSLSVPFNPSAWDAHGHLGTSMTDEAAAAAAGASASSSRSSARAAAAAAGPAHFVPSSVQPGCLHIV